MTMVAMASLTWIRPWSLLQALNPHFAALLHTTLREVHSNTLRMAWFASIALICLATITASADNHMACHMPGTGYVTKVVVVENHVSVNIDVPGTLHSRLIGLIAL